MAEVLNGMLLGFQSSDFDVNKLLKARDISPQVQRHLQHTYATLAAGVAMAFIGTLLHLRYHVGGLVTAVGFGVQGGRDERVF